MGMPTVKRMISRGWRAELAEKIRQKMEEYQHSPIEGLEEIDPMIEGFGVETIPEGNNSRSPEIAYVNMGDTYAETIMVVNNRFCLGSWGSIVESGNYD